MPTVTRSRTIDALPQQIWQVVADPSRLAEWWPRVQRVEDADAKAWTTVLASPKGGRTVRADYTLVRSEHPRVRRWRHEVAESPFERVLRASETEIRLEPTPGGGTAVQVSEELALRGFSRLGVPQVRRATRLKLEAALDGLERLLGGDGGER